MSWERQQQGVLVLGDTQSAVFNSVTVVVYCCGRHKRHMLGTKKKQAYEQHLPTACQFIVPAPVSPHSEMCNSFSMHTKYNRSLASES